MQSAIGAAQFSFDFQADPSSFLSLAAGASCKGRGRKGRQPLAFSGLRFLALELSAGDLRAPRARRWGSPLQVPGRFLRPAWRAREVSAPAYACLNWLNPPAWRFVVRQCIAFSHLFLFRCWRCCPALPGHVNAPLSSRRQSWGGTWLPLTHPRGSARVPTHP